MKSKQGYLENPLEEVSGECGAKEFSARAFDDARHSKGRGGDEERRGIGQQHPVPPVPPRYLVVPSAPTVATMC